MTSHHRQLIIAAVLAATGFAASAQTPATAPAAPEAKAQAGYRHDPARMQAWVAKRLAALKTTLKITPAQEAAWTAFSTAMTPNAATMKHPERAEFDKLTTPERIDRMRALRTQHMAEMDKRADATKTFYAALTPEQQKTFDAQRPGRHHGHEGMRSMHGMSGMGEQHAMHGMHGGPTQ